MRQHRCLYDNVQAAPEYRRSDGTRDARFSSHRRARIMALMTARAAPSASARAAAVFDSLRLLTEPAQAFQRRSPPAQPPRSRTRRQAAAALQSLAARGCCRRGAARRLPGREILLPCWVPSAGPSCAAGAHRISRSAGPRVLPPIPCLTLYSSAHSRVGCVEGNIPRKDYPRGLCSPARQARSVAPRR
jgi:hypothetical protein